MQFNTTGTKYIFGYRKVLPGLVAVYDRKIRYSDVLISELNGGLK